MSPSLFSLKFIMVVIIFLKNLSSSLTLTIIPFFFIGKHPLWPSNSTMIGYAIACYPLGSLIFSSLVGRLYDKFNPKRVLQLIVSCIILANLLIVIAIRSNYLELLMLGLFLNGLGESTVVVAKAFICATSKQFNKVFNLATLEIGAGCGWLIGPILGAATYNISSINTVLAGLPYATLLIAYLLLSCFVHLITPSPLHQKRSETLAKTQLSSLKCLWLPIIIWCNYVFAMEIILNLLSTFLIKVHQVSQMTIGAIISSLGLIYTLLSLLLVATRLIDFKQPAKVLSVSHIMLFVSCLLLIYLGINQIMLTLALFALGQVFSMPAGIALLDSQVTAENRGIIIGFATTFIAISTLSVGLFITPLMHWSTYLPFQVAAALLLCSSMLSLLFVKMRL